MPEIEMKAPLHTGMTAMMQARVPRQTAHELIVTGTRYPAELALERRIVDHAVPEEEVVGRAVELAAVFAAKADPAMQALKQGLYPHALEALGRSMDAI
jgi:enoyl-CoA hydratase/carnithine racemase